MNIKVTAFTVSEKLYYMNIDDVFSVPVSSYGRGEMRSVNMVNLTTLFLGKRLTQFSVHIE